MVDNLLDTSHAATLHDGTLGNAAMLHAETKVEERGPRSTAATRRFADIPTPNFFGLLSFQGGPVSIATPTCPGTRRRA